MSSAEIEGEEVDDNVKANFADVILDKNDPINSSL
jgi:hypothetical protein